MFSLAGKKALIVGVANDQSIAWGCARALIAQGAEVAITWADAKAEPHARPLAETLGAAILAPLDVREPAQMEAVFAEIASRWGRIDTLVHSVAFAPKDDLHGRVVDCSAQGFALAMDVSVHSFLRLIRAAEPMMTAGGCCQSVSFMGAGRVVPHYNMMGPVKAALESVVRSVAVELGAKGIRVHALSPGPMQTRAAGGIAHFDEMLEAAVARAPTHRLVSLDDVGAVCAFLASDAARNLTGGVHDIDGGFSITA